MNDSEFTGLINRYLDGEMGPEEKEQFEQSIAKNRKLQQKYLAIQKMADYTKNTTLIDPPAGIEAHVMQHISQKHTSGIQDYIPRFSEYIDNVIRPRRNVVFAFVSGLIAGCVIIAAWSNFKTLDTKNITGAIGVNAKTISQSLNLPLVGVNTTFEMQKVGMDVLCNIKITGQQPYELVLTSASQNISIQDYNVNSAMPVFVTSDIRKIFISGQTKAELFLKVRSDTDQIKKIDIRLISHGQEIQRKITFN